MPRPSIAFLSVVLVPFCLAGCGNKGELYLPPDLLLAEKLEAVNERINDADVEADDEPDTDKQKKPAGPTQ